MSDLFLSGDGVDWMESFFWEMTEYPQESESTPWPLPSGGQLARDARGQVWCTVTGGHSASFTYGVYMPAEDSLHPAVVGLRGVNELMQFISDKVTSQRGVHRGEFMAIEVTFSVEGQELRLAIIRGSRLSFDPTGPP